MATRVAYDERVGGADSSVDDSSVDSVLREATATSLHDPLGFAGNTMKVPRPNGTTLYLKLRDDPSTVDLVSLPVLPMTDAN